MLSLQRGELGGGCFPGSRGGGELVNNRGEFAVQMLRLAGLRVGLRRFQSGGEFVLLGLEPGDLLLKLADLDAELFQIGRVGFLCVGNGLCRLPPAGLGFRLRLFGPGIGETGGERGPGVGRL
jgi:hypothetical protein